MNLPDAPLPTEGFFVTHYFTAKYQEKSKDFAMFLTAPLDNHGWEWRCCMRDPDGYLIEVGRYTQLALDHFKKYVT